jgi:CheY-like chemotaxis protein
MSSLRVFIVDDDRVFAESLALFLEGRGHHVDLAFSGEEAIAKFHEQDFIAFMDRDRRAKMARRALYRSASSDPRPES